MEEELVRLESRGMGEPNETEMNGQDHAALHRAEEVMSLTALEVERERKEEKVEIMRFVCACLYVPML